MNNRSEIPSFDPDADKINALAGIPTDSDPWSIDRDANVIERRETQAQLLRTQHGLIAHQALAESRADKVIPVDNDAPKRDRARLRAPE